MNFKMDKEQLLELGKKGLHYGGRLGKAIVVEGVKGLALKTATKAITTGFEGGVDGVKQLTFDDVVGKPKVKEDKPKKKLWSFKKDKEEIEEILEEVEDMIDWQNVNDEIVETFEGEIIDKK